MDRAAESGLELKPSTTPELAPQPDGNMYYTEGGAPNDTVIDRPNQFDQSYQPRAKSPGRSRVIWVVTGIGVVCVAVAIGAGLGAGMAVRHRSSSSRYAPCLTTCPTFVHHFECLIACST